MKSSSRAGRFKKKLVSSDELVKEAPVLLPQLALFHDLFTAGQISSAEFTASYLLLFLSHRFPGNWLGSKHEQNTIEGISWRELPFSFEPNVSRRLSKVTSPLEIFANFTLKSTPQTVNRALVEWARGQYQLELMFRIPSPGEVLSQQKRGRRCVTALVDERISRYILGERDALSFTMHDLIHADHFFHHNDCFKGQLGFYGLLSETLPYFDQSHEKFAAEFDYLISDMNAYPIHLLKCLKSAMIHHFHEDYFSTWMKSTDAPREMALLNSGSYVPETMDPVILNWLDQFRSQGM